MEKEKDRGNIILIVLMIILVLLMCGAFVGMFFMMKEADNLRSEINELKEEKQSDASEKEENKQEGSTKCKSIVGAYYAEVIQDNLHMKQTYSFSADGTYITYVENGGATNGTYTLVDGVINFKQKYEIGPEHEVMTFSRNVSDDCSIIYVNEENLSYELKRVAE